VARSRDNFARNQSLRGEGKQLAPTTFIARNLFEMTPEMLMADGIADKWLIDPPREGAFALAKAMAELHENDELRGAWQFPKRIVYVSCNPRRWQEMQVCCASRAGYRCISAGVINMFAHTAHVESMAVFERIA
jgi:23S rRNA (uracil1939-C5)-methyltransferase